MMTDEISNKRDESAGLRDIHDQLPPNAIVEREVAMCEVARETETEADPEGDVETAVTETYGVGFSRDKLKRHRVKLKLTHAVTYGMFFTLSLAVLVVGYATQSLLVVGYVAFIPSDRVLLALVENWLGFGLLLATFLLAAWALSRELSRILRSRRLVAYHEWSPEPGVTVTDRAFVSSRAGRFWAQEER